MKAIAITAALACWLVLSTSTSHANLYYYGSTYKLAIPSADEIESASGKGAMKTAELFIPEHRTVRDLEVYIGITHGCFSDLEITLISPAGKRVLLTEWGNVGLVKVGGRRQMIFDDQAAAAFSAATDLGMGKSYVPVNSLSNFYGQDAYGTWKINISDHLYDHSGTLDYVRLVVTNPEPATICLISLGMMVLRGKRRV